MGVSDIRTQPKCTGEKGRTEFQGGGYTCGAWQRAVSLYPAPCTYLCDCSKQNAVRKRRRGNAGDRGGDVDEVIMSIKL